MKTKEKMIKLGRFEDCEYLDKYCNIIDEHLETDKIKFITQSHHIVPQYLNLKDDTTVNLPIGKHALAHLYLGLSAIDDYDRLSNFSSVKFIIHRGDFPTDEVDFIKNLSEYETAYNEYARLNSELQIGKQSGDKNPFYGKHHSEETRQKMREHSRHLSGENHPNYGNHLSDEAKKQISIANTNRVKTKEEIEKRLNTIKEQGGATWVTDEYKELLSIRRKEFFADDRNRKAQSDKTKSLWENEEYRLKHINAMRGKKRTINRKPCPFCGREISLSNFKRHTEKCEIKIKGDN